MNICRWVLPVVLLASTACSGAASIDPLAPVPTRVDPNEVATPPLRVAWTVSSDDESGDSEVPVRAAAVGSRAVFVAYADRLDALDIDDGETLWEARLNGPLTFAPVAFHEGVLVATEGGWLWFNADGAPTATAALPGPVNDALLVGGAVVVVSGDQIALLDRTGGSDLSIVWTVSLPGGRRVGAGPDGTALYVTNEDGSVTALTAATGNVRWRSTEIVVAPLRPAVDRAVYVIDRNGRLHALRPRDGRREWSAKDVGVRVSGSPVVRDGLVWVPGLDAAVHAFTAGGGSHQHRIRGNGRLHLDLAVWGAWVVASPQYGPWVIVQGPRNRVGPADPGSPRILRIESDDSLALPPAVDSTQTTGVVVIDSAGTIRLLTPEQGAEGASRSSGAPAPDLGGSGPASR